MTKNLSSFHSVFLEKEDINQNATYICCCKKSFPNIYELVLHESLIHFIEFSRVVTKLKKIIDEFIIPEPKIETRSGFDKLESVNSSPKYSDDDNEVSVDDVPEQEDEIIRRLQGLGGVSLQIKSSNTYKDKSESKTRQEKVTLKKISSPLFKKIVPKSSIPTEFKCRHCNLKFSNRNLRLDHERKTHKYICDLCGRIYLTKPSLVNHFSLQHEGIKTYCSDCGRYCKDLETHMKTHENDPYVLCDTCGMQFKGKYKLQKHLNRCHKSINARFFCNYCGKGYKFQADLKVHILKHEPNKRDFKCSQCDKTFKMKSEMKRHSMIHLGIKWPCPDCGSEFAWKRGLRNHQKNNCKARKILLLDK